MKLGKICCLKKHDLYSSTWLSEHFSNQTLRSTYDSVHGQRPPLVLGLALDVLHLGRRVLEADVVKDFRRQLIEESNSLPVELHFEVSDLVDH